MTCLDDEVQAFQVIFFTHCISAVDTRDTASKETHKRTFSPPVFLLLSPIQHYACSHQRRDICFPSIIVNAIVTTPLLWLNLDFNG